MDTTNPPDVSPALNALQSQLAALITLSERLSAARRASLALLRLPPPVTSGAALDPLTLGLPGVFGTSSSAVSVRTYFEQLKELKTALLAPDAQAALKTAAASFKADPKGVGLGSSSAERGRSLSPGSPQPYQPSRDGPPDLFPPLRDGDTALSADRLAAFIREFNTTIRFPAAKLALWSPVRPTRSRPQARLPDSPILRLTIADVLVAYVTLDHDPDAPALAVESVNCFSPREKKGPHACSDWLVFQTLSQQFARALGASPTVAVQQLLDMLLAYGSLFTAPCARCGRILSQDGHVPPVVRVWTSKRPSVPTPTIEQPISALERVEEDVPTGAWEPRHVACARD